VIVFCFHSTFICDTESRNSAIKKNYKEYLLFGSLWHSATVYKIKNNKLCLLYFAVLFIYVLVNILYIVNFSFFYKLKFDFLEVFLFISMHVWEKFYTYLGVKRDCQPHNYPASLRSAVYVYSAGNPLLPGLCSNVLFNFWLLYVYNKMYVRGSWSHFGVLCVVRVLERCSNDSSWMPEDPERIRGE
jgi:hypothetical protein